MLSLSLLGLMAVSVRQVLADYPTCLSYGMDFQNGGSYFQNSQSDDNFTFVTQYDDCQDDVAYNILVDPNGDQTLCSDTRLTPDDTNMLSTCPIKKSQLRSGAWSVVVMSNNGKADPIAYERDFQLSVAPQSTVTYTPTATATLVSTPVVTVTSTTTETATTVLSPETVTSPSTTVTPTKTVTPASVTSTTTKALLTLNLTVYDSNVSKVTKTVTASCQTPTKPATADPRAKIHVTVGPAATMIGARFRREVLEAEKVRFVEERRIRIEARAPDPQPLTVTDSNTDDWPTVTVTSTAPAVTATATTAVYTTTTSTPPPITVSSGTTTAPVVTVTAPTPTRTVTRYEVVTIAVTKTKNYVYTITTTTTPAAIVTACKQAGGIIV